MWLFGKTSLKIPQSYNKKLFKDNIPLLIYHIDKHLLNVYYVSSTMLSAENIKMINTWAVDKIM